MSRGSELTNWHVQIHEDAVELCSEITGNQPSTLSQNNVAKYVLMSPMATLMASEPSATTTHRHPSRMSSVSMILAVMGLSSANKHVTARSFGSGARLRSIETTDDGGVLGSNCPDAWCCSTAPPDQESETEPSVVETDAVRSRLGIEFRRETSPSRWLSLKRSTAPNSDGFRA